MTQSSRQLSQSNYVESSAGISTVVAYAVLFLLFVYYGLQYLDFPVLPISELAWNALVYITPLRLISFLHPSSDITTQQEAGGDSKSPKSAGYARKSEAMRNILGLDGTGIMSNVQRARSLSGVGAITKGVPSTAPPGLGNWDNSCYQNSILQGLASLRSLPGYLTQISETENTHFERHSTKAALRDLLARLSDPASAGKMFWTPAELKSMSSWQQQDAQEYFSKVLDEVEKESSKSVDTTARNVGLAALATLERDLSEKHPEHSAATTAAVGHPSAARSLYELPDELASVVTRNPLEGLLAQRVGCLRCGYVEGLSLIPFNCLTVPLGQQWMYDIRSCLDEYTALESINGVECAKCTLLHTKQQLERLLSQIHAKSHDDGDPTMPVTLKSLEDTSNERLAAVNTALEDEDFSDNTLLKKCQINPKSRISTTKSRQAVIARAPTSLVIHINRSVFDEFTGAQMKNFADVRFPYRFDFSHWCLGEKGAPATEEEAIERWNTDPAASMLSPNEEDRAPHFQRSYELRAAVTHYGRHENGHYICYRKYPSPLNIDSPLTDKVHEPWWRLSDDEVSQVTEHNVLSQGGVFMLFYEQVEQAYAPVQQSNILNGNSEQGPVVTEQEVTQDTKAAFREEASPILIQREDGIADSPSIPDPVDVPAVQKPTKLEHAVALSGAEREPVPATCDTNNSPASAAPASSSAVVEHNATTVALSASAEIDPINESHPSDVGPSTPTAGIPEGNKTSLSKPSSSSPVPEETIKENRQITPAMRTAPPRSGRGSMSRGGKGIGQVSSMVTAN